MAGLGDPAQYPLFPSVGIPTFLRSRVVEDIDHVDADIVVLGVPTDEGSPYRPGSRFAPRAIREHSLRFASGATGYYDPERKRSYLETELGERRIADAGDAPILPTNVAATFDGITTITKAIVSQGALPVVLGGDHSVPYPVVRAFTEPMHVFQFDAHLDYEPFENGLELTNGHAFRHISNMPHVQSLTQIGIRSIRNPKGGLDDSINDGNRVVTMEQYDAEGIESVIGDVPLGSNCYVSIDIDALDMSLVPGCVSAEPNGMSYRALRDGLTVLAEKMRIVGFDLCEVNPLLDVGTGVTSYLATYTILEFLGRICSQPHYRSGDGGAET